MISFPSLKLFFHDSCDKMLGGEIDQKTGPMDWNRPQPYNEKLRLTRTEEERLALARTQVGMVDALKGKYRKRAIEYPHR